MHHYEKELGNEVPHVENMGNFIYVFMQSISFIKIFPTKNTTLGLSDEQIKFL